MNRNSSKTLSRIGIGFILSLLFLPFVLANYPDNFDGYTSTTKSPGPWTLTESMSSCFTGTYVDQLSPVTDAFSQPNVYNFAGASTGGCYTVSQNANLTARVQASGRAIAVGFEYRNPTSAGSNSSSWTFSIYICGSLVGSAPPGHSTSYWEFYNFSTTSTAGTYCNVSFILATVSSGSPHVVDSWIDNVFIYGANVVVPGANLFLFNYPSQQLFNIQAYQNSSIRINYDQAFDCPAWGFIQASSSVCIQNDIVVPDFNISLTHAVLITVDVGGGVPYTRTIIPQPNLLFNTTPSNQTVYLDQPSACPSICSYQLTINDLTGFYPTGTEVFVSQGSYVITSAPIDVQSIMALTMRPSNYNLTLISPDNLHTISGSLSLTATNSAPSFLIQNGSVPITIGPFQQFTGSATWDCDLGGITSTVTDSLGTMTTEVFNLYRYNASALGGVLIASHTTVMSGAPGFSVAYNFRNSTIGTQNLNSSTSNEYTVGWVLTTPEGSQAFGQYPISLSSSCSAFPNAVGSAGGFAVPAAILGLNQIMNGGNAYEELFSVIILIASVGIMAARFAHMTMFVLGGEVGILVKMTWLPPGMAVLAGIFLAIGAAGVLVNRARKPIT